MLTTRHLARTALFTAIATSTMALAEEPVLEELTVTASRVNKSIKAIPNTVKIIDRQALENQLAVSSSLLDGLSFAIPALTPAHQKMSSNGVTLRGRNPLYMTDGVPQSTPLRNGQRSAFTIDPAFIDRVEVIYGANAIQGVGATGGVINYVTTDAPDDGRWLAKSTLELTSDSFEGDGTHYKASGLLGKSFDSTDFILGVSYQVQDLFYDADGDPIAPDPVQGDIMDSEANNVFAKWGWDIADDQRLEFMANYFELEGDAPNNEATNLAVTYSHDDFFQGALTLQGFYYDFYALYGGGTYGSFQDPTIAPDGQLFDQSALSSEKFGGKATWVRENALWDGLQLALGLDYLEDETYQELAQTGRIWVPKMTYRGWAPFVQLEQRLMGDRLRLSGGARYEDVELDIPDFTTVAGAGNTFVEGGKPSFEEVLGNVGVVFDLTDQVTAFASYAEGFDMPDAGLILRGVDTPNLSVTDLVDLEPIIADNTEVGVSYNNGGLELAMSYFWSDSDFGSRIQVIDGIGHLTRQKTEIEGLEVSAVYAMDNGLRTGLAYSQLEGRYDSNGDGAIDKDLDGRNIAPDRVNLYVEGGLTNNLFGRVQYSILLDRDFQGGLPEHDFEGYELLDALATYRHHSWGEFTVGVENLLDKEYITYFSQTLTYTNDSTYFAGRGRTYNLRWEKAF